jgi:3-hydroxybutyryl-CoA dehydrogenase
MINRIAIIGAGLMGHGLALVFANGGYDVTITDPMSDTLANVKVRIAETLAALGKDVAAVEKIQTMHGLEETVQNADLVIEAAPEKLALKQGIFEELDRVAKPDAILASNTSVIPIGRIAARVGSKHRVVGTHWWNPPYLVPLVEVIQTEGTSPETIVTIMELLSALGKVPVYVKKDVPGFVGNRLQHALWREAIALVAEGVCDADTVDLVVKNSFGRRLAVLGPLENADLVGTDLTLDIHEQVLPYINSVAGPSPYLQSLVQNGNLGFKSGQGFKNWTENKKNALRATVQDHLKTMNALLGN